MTVVEIDLESKILYKNHEDLRAVLHCLKVFIFRLDKRFHSSYCIVTRFLQFPTVSEQLEQASQ